MKYWFFITQWALSIMLCLFVEYYTNLYLNMTGAGFILALLFLPLIWKDIQEIKK